MAMAVSGLCLDTSLFSSPKLTIINMCLCVAMAYSGALMVTKSGESNDNHDIVIQQKMLERFHLPPASIYHFTFSAN